MKNISIAELDQYSDAVLIDVRTEEEYAEGHIDGAINLPTHDLQAKIGEIVPDKNTPVILNCRSGGRSLVSCVMLDMLGYKHTYNLEGGYLAYKKITNR